MATAAEEKRVGLTDMQIAAEVARAQSDIEERLNTLEHRIGRAVVSMQLEQLDITTALDDRRRAVRAVRIVFPPAAGQIGKV